MTGDEFLKRGAELRQAQIDLHADIARAKQSGLGANDSHLRDLMLRLHLTTAELDALTREFLEG